MSTPPLNHSIRDIWRTLAYRKSLSKHPCWNAPPSAQPRWEKLRYGIHRHQYVLRAAQRDPQAPVAIWIHGGGWRFGSPESLEVFGHYFFQQGYEVLLPSHRRLPRFRGWQIADDIRMALDIGLSGGKTGRSLLLGGMSSGAHLAATAAFKAGQWLPEHTISGLISCGGPLCLDQLGFSPVVRTLAGQSDKDLRASLNPIEQLRRSAQPPPFKALLIHGTNDGLVPVECSLAFYSEARQLGWEDIELITIPQGDHLAAVRWIMST